MSTGFGALATTVIPPERRARLQVSLIRSHAAGMGPPVEAEVVRAMMFLRARTLALGASGTRPLVAEAIVGLVNAGITPLVPEHGSLGASGDLAPLAHAALALLGEGEVLVEETEGQLRMRFLEDGLFSADLEPLAGDTIMVFFDGGDGQALSRSPASFVRQEEAVMALDLGQMGRDERVP